MWKYHDILDLRRAAGNQNLVVLVVINVDMRLNHSGVVVFSVGNFDLPHIFISH